MQPLFSFVIPRHYVVAGPNGLSPLQEALINHPARISIASAPTGAAVSKEQRLAINSADDSSTGGLPRDFCAGRDADPMKTHVLIASGSIIL